MGDETNAFYMVRKGDSVGVYKSISDLQSNVNDPSVAVYKGFDLSKEAEEYLSSLGFKNAMYSFDASNMQNPLFGQLVICPFPGDNLGSTSKLNHFLHVPPISSDCSLCIVEFAGASNNNLGPAGAGAVLRSADGSMVFQLREGLGIATTHAAEYRGAILGIKYALQKGFKRIHVQGNSKIVYMQVMGHWEAKNNMADLCKKVKELKDQFLSFEIFLVEKKNNSEADAQAKQGAHMKEGECQVQYEVE